MSSESPTKIVLFPKPGKGIIEEIITESQPGRVNFQATYWPARLYNSEQKVTLLPNTSVNIIGREGITLLVVPVSEVEESDLEAKSRNEKTTNNYQRSAWTQKFGFLWGFRLN
ncbi:MAG: NfeD family protein [Coleofasciculaceae cyanobacterium]